MIQLIDLKGRWYIHQTNFPMWLKGDKISPTFNYGIIKKEECFVLSDKVEYFQNGNKKNIKGISKPINDTNSEFIWRGNGLLRLLKSKWKILYLDVENKWAIIDFKKTLFTPGGYDVISRHAELSGGHKQIISEKLKEFGIHQQLKTISQHKNQ